MSKVSLDQKVEEDLINRAQKDIRYFSGLYSHYQPLIRKYFLRHVALTAAEDLTAVTFEKALKGLANFRWQGVSFSAWLYRIANHTLIDYYRRVNRENKSKADFTEVETIPTKQKGPEEAYLDLETTELLSDLLKTLSDREKTVIYLKFYEGLTNKTIAAQLELTETNVSTIIYRSVSHLREKLLSQPEGPIGPPS